MNRIEIVRQYIDDIMSKVRKEGYSHERTDNNDIP